MGQNGTPEDGRKNNGHFPKPWAGRKKLADPSLSKKRPQHQVRAFEHEWVLVKRFVKIVRKSPETCEKILRVLEE